MTASKEQVGEAGCDNTLHLATGATNGVLLVSGTRGGVAGPSEIYEDLAERLRANGMTSIRVNYTKLHQVESGVTDVLTAIEKLAAMGIKQVGTRGLVVWCGCGC